MFALADCNNFYASCERVFQPHCKNKPVAVLSNNDGCVIARSDEVKAIGITIGMPYFKIKKEIKENDIAVFSSHYTLYADMSARVMTNIARFTPDVEVYSIDECFFGLKGFPNLHSYTQTIRDTVIRNTGIPISIGVAPTKVLAKLANKLAKKNSGIMVLDNENKITEALIDYPVGDVWGIGRKFARKLIGVNVNTAADFRNLSVNWVQKNMSVIGVRIWRELWGQSCIPLKTMLDPKKGIFTSRGFGKATDDFIELQEATTSYTARLAGKLRREKLCATMLSVRLLTNRFNEKRPQTYPSRMIYLPYPVNNTNDLVKEALAILPQIYLSGYLFQKVEVMAAGLIPENEVQLNIFDSFKGLQNNKLSKLMDKINNYYGDGTLRVATEGNNQKWTLRRDFLSPEYTTNWKDIIKVK